jgi:hypothetical protein
MNRDFKKYEEHLEYPEFAIFMDEYNKVETISSKKKIIKKRENVI